MHVTKPKRPDPEEVQGSEAGPPGSKGVRRSRGVDAQVLLHELRVHQLELEMQNEELRSARGEMELALQRYTELFDFAPIGYVTLQAGDVISDINHAGTQILGRTRATLCGTRFARLVTDTDQRAFDHLLATAKSSGDKQSCELALLRPNGEAFAARSGAVALMRSEATVLLSLEDLGPRQLDGETQRARPV
jgi:PAS domain S-box-containing protein